MIKTQTLKVAGIGCNQNITSNLTVTNNSWLLFTSFTILANHYLPVNWALYLFRGEF